MLAACAGAVLSLVTMSSVSAQSAPALSLAVGVTQFDLSGTGTAPLGVARASVPLNRVIGVEVGVGVAQPEQQSVGHTVLVIPEAQILFGIPGTISPYLGLGGGFATDTRGEGVDAETRVTASGSVGARWRVGSSIGLRGELRVRGIGSKFQGTAGEWTIGLVRRF